LAAPPSSVWKLCRHAARTRESQATRRLRARLLGGPGLEPPASAHILPVESASHPEFLKCCGSVTQLARVANVPRAPETAPASAARAPRARLRAQDELECV
jgi:hypothetical protein